MTDPYSIILAPNASLMTGAGTNTIILGSDNDGATVIDLRTVNKSISTQL